ncbi:MAG: hypothetical protein P4L69_08295 [Desulfosporosinus sp.]|nr:hypothetical protein [Desulfosporosinus sp.]
MSSISPVSSQQYSNVSQSQQTDQTTAVKKHHHHHKSQQTSDTQNSSSSSSPQDILELGTQNSSQPITYSKPANQAQATQLPIPE